MNDTTLQNEELKTSQLNQEICQKFAYVTQPDFQKISPFEKAEKNKLPDLFKRIRAKLNIP